MRDPDQDYVRPIEARFTERQLELLQEYADEIDMPIGILVRETVQAALLTYLEQQRRQKALEWMACQRLPVEDWEKMEAELESRWIDCAVES